MSPGCSDTPRRPPCWSTCTGRSPDSSRRRRPPRCWPLGRQIRNAWRRCGFPRRGRWWYSARTSPWTSACTRGPTRRSASFPTTTSPGRSPRAAGPSAGWCCSPTPAACCRTSASGCWLPTRTPNGPSPHRSTMSGRSCAAGEASRSSTISSSAQQPLYQVLPGGCRCPLQTTSACPSAHMTLGGIGYERSSGFATTNAMVVPLRHGCSIWRGPASAPPSRDPRRAWLKATESRNPVSSPRPHLVATRASRSSGSLHPPKASRHGRTLPSSRSHDHRSRWRSRRAAAPTRLPNSPEDCRRPRWAPATTAHSHPTATWISISMSRASGQPPRSGDAHGPARQPDPFGIPASHGRYAASLEELRRAGRFDCRTPQALRRAMETLRRDQALQDAGGRWVIGRPDPVDFVPGDIAAIRKIVGGTTVLKDALLAQIKHAWPSTGGEVALTRAAADTMLIELTTAVPYFIPAAASGAVLFSHPPAPALLERLRLPFAQVLVVFGADLELDPGTYTWPDSLRRATTATAFDLVYGMLTRGGYLTGMVLLADEDGRLRDDVIWIVAANPDPALPPPACLDRVRGMLRGWRTAATLAPIAHTVAAAVAWGGWRPPAPAPDLPGDPASRQWRKTTKRNAFLARERRGDMIGVHVIDLESSLAAAQSSLQPGEESLRQRASPRPHDRRGHSRRVRIGPRDAWHYEQRWIPPVRVLGDRQQLAPPLTVRCLPAPSSIGDRPLNDDPLSSLGRPALSVSPEELAEPGIDLA